MKAKKTSCTGLLKVSIFINNRATQSDLRIAGIIYHKIAAIYRELKHQYILQELLAIQKLKYLEYFSLP